MVVLAQVYDLKKGGKSVPSKNTEEHVYTDLERSNVSLSVSSYSKALIIERNLTNVECLKLFPRLRFPKSYSA